MTDLSIYNMAFITNGTIHIIDNDKIYDDSFFVSVSLSVTYPDTVLALDIEGYIWVRDNTGKFHLVTFPSSVTFTSISCGYNLIIALDFEGCLWVWNRNDLLSQTNLLNGKLSLDTRFICACCGFHIACIDEDGNLWSSQYIESPQPFQVPEVENEDTCNNNTELVNISDLFKSQNVKFILCSCDNCATIALDENGKLWIYGCRDYKIFPTDNIYGLNRLYISSENTFTSLSSECGNAIAIDEDGILWAVGYNIYPDSVVDDDDQFLG